MAEKTTNSIVKSLIDRGYWNITRINGKLCGLHRFIYTVGLVVDVDEGGYSYRYCYSSSEEAEGALKDWKESGDAEPKGFIKRKG